MYVVFQVGPGASAVPDGRADGDRSRRVAPHEWMAYAASTIGSLGELCAVGSFSRGDLAHFQAAGDGCDRVATTKYRQPGHDLDLDVEDFAMLIAEAVGSTAEALGVEVRLGVRVGGAELVGEHPRWDRGAGRFAGREDRFP